MSRNIVMSVGIAILVALGGFLWMQNQQAPKQYAELESLVEVADVQAADEGGYVVQEMVLGSEDAPVTVVEYASFTCPHCANFHKDVFGTIKADYIETGKVKFVMRDVYFDRFGLWAAMLARCDSDKFFGISDMIYKRQREWTKGDDNAQIVQNLMKLGRLAGMDDDTMNACLQDNSMAQALVVSYQENAARDDISSTPSFIINGRKYPNMPLSEFTSTLDELINK